jgi:hypothetical protein
MSSLDWDIKTERDTSKIEEVSQKEYEENLDFLKAFSTTSGKKVMEWLTLHTLDSPTWWPAQSEKFGYFREGQNSLVRQLKAKIQQAKQYQEKQK